MRETKKVMINYLDLCSGAGGLSLGFHKTKKYNPIEFIEIDKKCCETLKENFPEHKKNINNKDINDIDFTNKKYKNLDLITIGSPCQSFSYAGNKEGFADKRGNLLLKFIEILAIIKPKMFLIENVRGLKSHDEGKSLKLLLRKLEKTGYNVKHALLNSVNYNVPQKRVRLFIFGIYTQSSLDASSPSVRVGCIRSRSDRINRSVQTMGLEHEEFVSTRPQPRDVNTYKFPKPNDNIITLEKILKKPFPTEFPNEVTSNYNDKKKKYFKKIPQGGCWTSLSVSDQKEYLGKSYFSGGGKRGILRRLSYNEPSLTILCSPQQKQTERCHPSENRPLTIRESARIQTFPDSYIFKGSICSQYKQIGNAVPVKLAKYLAKSIYKYYKKIKKEEEDKEKREDKDINFISDIIYEIMKRKKKN